MDANSNIPDSIAKIGIDLAERHAKLMSRKEELMAAAGRVPTVKDPKDPKREMLPDQETSDRLADFIKQFTTALNKADAQRLEEKDPFWRGGQAVDAFFNVQVINPLEKEKKRLLGLQTDWMNKIRLEKQAELDRAAAIAREEERKKIAAAERAAAAARGAVTQQRAAEAAEVAKQAEANRLAAEAAASTKAADLTRTRGEHGGTQSLRTEKTFKPFDSKKLSLRAMVTLQPYIAQAAMEQAVRGAIKAGIYEIDGIEVYDDYRAQ